MRPSRFLFLLITALALPVLGQGESDANSPEVLFAFRAVAKAWSLPSDASGVSQVWPGDRPEDLAAAALLWKSGGPPPEEGWRLHTAEKSWEGAARKAGVPVDALLKEYRGLMSDQTREALAGTGEEWLVLAEIRTLERLTGRGARAIAAELARSDFQALLLEALPEAGADRRSAALPGCSRSSPAQPVAGGRPGGPLPREGRPQEYGDHRLGNPAEIEVRKRTSSDSGRVQRQHLPTRHPDGTARATFGRVSGDVPAEKGIEIPFKGRLFMRCALRTSQEDLGRSVLAVDDLWFATQTT